MSNMLSDLKNELTSLENNFQESLSRLGNTKLAQDFADITTIQRAIEILSNRSVKSEPIETAKPAKVVEQTNGTFQTTQAVREMIQSLNGKEFTTADIFEKLSEKYPKDVTLERKPSVSATLSNLSKSGEIIVVFQGGAGMANRFKEIDK